MSKHKNKILLSGLCAVSIFGLAGISHAQSLFEPVETKGATKFDRFMGSENLFLTTQPRDLSSNFVEPKPQITAFNESRSWFRLEGEEDITRLSFQHDLRNSGTVGDLIIAYKNAVSVMPEASSVNVRVNGYPVGNFDINSPSEFAEHKFLVPANVLLDGENTVDLHAIQRHRVDCSFDATYELWTDIDFMKSGFLAAESAPIDSLAALKKISRSENGLTDLRLILSKDSQMDDLNAALPVIQTLSLALGRDDISVTVSDRAGVGPGIDLYLSTMNRPQPENPVADQAPRGLTVTPTANKDRVSVVLKATSRDRLNTQLLTAIRGPLQPMIDKTIEHGKHLEIVAEAGGVYTLGEAGYKSSSFSGRLFRTGFDMIMPSDFYPAEYATVDIGLHAATSPGLKPESQLLVRVNGQIVKSLPMRDVDGEVFEGRRIELPMRAFRPGRNQIEILAEVERERDDTCVYTERDETEPRFILLENTEIRVPKLARISRLPDLSVTAGSGYPYITDNNLEIYAAHSDSRTLSAALTMLTKLSYTAKTPLDATVMLGRPNSADLGNKLVIAPRRAFLEKGPIEEGGHREVSSAIRFYDADWLPDLITTASIENINLPEVTEASSEDLLEAFKHKTKKSAKQLSWTTVVRQKFDDGLFQFKSWLRYKPNYDTEPTGDVAENRKANLVQTVDSSNKLVVTWLTADTPEDVVRASQVLADPAVWNRVSGADVTVDLHTKNISAAMPESYVVHALTDKTPGNLRRLTAAWFSDNFLVYVGLIILFLGAFGAWLGRIVPEVGVRNDKS